MKRARYIAFNLRNSIWCVLDRSNGELVARANGLTQRYPQQWAREKAKQLNQGEK